MGLLDYATTKNKIRKLNNVKTDLTNDGTAIRNYNNHIDSIISDFQSFVRCGSYEVVNRLDNYREPYQYNDSNLSTAVNYVQREINVQEKSLSAANECEGGGGYR